MDKFLEEVDKFKLWAEIAEQKYGEWETEYLHWATIYQSAEQLINTAPVSVWTSELIESFLYILARDNECENIMDTLIQYPGQLLFLAELALDYEEYQARWQMAYGLGELKGNQEEIAILLEQFSVDENEYVRRRASFALEKRGL